VLLGLANIRGAISTSFPMLFATRILAGIGSGGVFPVALGLTSDLVGPERRQVAIGRTLAGAMTATCWAVRLRLIGDFLGWRGVLAVLGGLVVVASVAVAVWLSVVLRWCIRPEAACRRSSRAIGRSSPIRTRASATRRCSSKGAACSACFPSSPRSCSVSAKPRSRSPAS